MRVTDLKVGNSIYKIEYSSFNGECIFDFFETTIARITDKQIGFRIKRFQTFTSKWYLCDDIFRKNKEKFDLEGYFESREELLRILKTNVDKTKRSDDHSENWKKSVENAYNIIIENVGENTNQHQK